MTETQALRVTYDRSADVLYVSARQEPATKGVQDRRGIVWRYDRTGALIGATILDYHELWGLRRSELTKELSKRFAMSERDIEHALRA